MRAGKQELAPLGGSRLAQELKVKERPHGGTAIVMSLNKEKYISPHLMLLQLPNSDTVVTPILEMCL